MTTKHFALTVKRDGKELPLIFVGECEAGASLNKMSAIAMSAKELPAQLRMLRGALLEWTEVEAPTKNVGWHAA